MVDLVIGDAHELFVDALRAVLPEHGFTVAGAANTVAETVRAVRRHRPQVCLLGRSFPDGDGVDALGALLDAGGPLRVIVLAAGGDTKGMRRALEAGAAGYIDTCRGLMVLVKAVHTVLRGEVVVELAAASAARASGQADVERLAGQLTARERECLELLVQGVRTTAMARHLGVSTTTVRTHVQAILTKLGVHSRLEAASFALRHGLTDGLAFAGGASGVPSRAPAGS